VEHGGRREKMATGESTAPAKRSLMGTEEPEPADVDNFFGGEALHKLLDTMIF
jgi:hypothetical protein